MISIINKLAGKYDFVDSQNRGITLIALIVTIIVMLILVEVTISMAINGGLFKYAGEAVLETTVAQDIEKIQACVTTAIMDEVSTTGEIELTKEGIEKYIENDKQITVSDKRPEDEYVYVVTLNNRQYGIKDNNEVEYIQGIYNKYIYVNYVNEVTPKYLFKNTVTQNDIDKEVNGENVPYYIVGVSKEIDGDYKTEGVITGKSGELNILNLQYANFEYTLTDFFDGDEIFYIKINDTIEKIQKIVVVQGDEVRYEENFNGIAYTGEWNRIEDEKYSNGAAMMTSQTQDKFDIKFAGSGYNLFIACSEENDGRMTVFQQGTSNRVIIISWDNENYVFSFKDLDNKNGAIDEDGFRSCDGETTELSAACTKNYSILDSIVIRK